MRVGIVKCPRGVKRRNANFFPFRKFFIVHKNKYGDQRVSIPRIYRCRRGRPPRNVSLDVKSLGVHRTMSR